MSTLKKWIVGICILFLIITAGQIVWKQTQPEKKLCTEEKKERIAAMMSEVVLRTKGEVLVDLSPIENRNISDLYGEYLGLQGKVPNSARIDFERNLARLWTRKISRKDTTETTCVGGNNVIEYYHHNRTKTDIRSYVRAANREISFAKNRIDWATVCRLMKLDKERCTLLNEIVNNLVGKDLIAYGLTELMPAADGRFNIQYIDILLRHAGSEYVENLPALGDGMFSLGLYQITSLALFNDGKSRRGASVINEAVNKDAKIPDSVTMLRGGQHHRAAFYFAIYNLAALIRRLDSKETATLRANHQNYKEEMIQYIAIAHHQPRHAIKGTKKWIANGMRGPLNRSLSERLSRYSVKTRANLISLYEVIK